MKPLYAIITHNNQTSHVEVFDDDTIENMKEFFKRCIGRDMTPEESDEFENGLCYLYIEKDHDNTYTFELFHPEM